ncbi:hypothetical protein EVAR_49967_1 [Eumeta japonica]|uniref:Uncharacterized protein n=1 Tax=Eumeta variegata TaxID=151549 RepID=A0A4C1YM45_EUMVA|nr:hypothetical protein EVAR_49967_1 [Eumeta japonica]
MFYASFNRLTEPEAYSPTTFLFDIVGDLTLSLPRWPNANRGLLRLRTAVVEAMAAYETNELSRTRSVWYLPNKSKTSRSIRPRSESVPLLTDSRATHLTTDPPTFSFTSLASLKKFEALQKRVLAQTFPIVCANLSIGHGQKRSTARRYVYIIKYLNDCVIRCNLRKYNLIRLIV